MLEHHPTHVRRKIALLITGGVALVLVIVLILVYSRKKAEPTNDSGSNLKHFYDTIVDTGQQYFGGN